MAPKREQKKRLGKKHRQASTRPKKGKAPRAQAVTGAVPPKARKKIATKRAEAERKAKTPRRSPEFEGKRTIAPDGIGAGEERKGVGRVGGRISKGPQKPADMDEAQWREAERIGEELSVELARGPSGPGLRREGGALGVDPELEEDTTLPLVAICGRPNVGKSTLFNRLTGSRRSIVGDEPGITRDRIYGEVEWSGRDVRIVDTGGVVPDDEALIPSEIFRQAQVALEEADAIVMVVDGRTELASPDMELARLLLRGGKPCFLAVNKMDTEAMLPQAENFRRLGFRNVMAISAEHGSGIGDLLDEVFAVLPAAPEVEPERMEGIEEEAEEDMDGPVDVPVQPRKLRTHGEFDQTETKIAIIGRPNVGKSTLLNALTGTDRAIVSADRGDDAGCGGRGGRAGRAQLPVCGYGGDPTEGQDEADGGEAKRDHGAEAPGGGGREPAGDRRDGGGDGERREHWRVCA